jgi:hypothetical protein
MKANVQSGLCVPSEVHVSVYDPPGDPADQDLKRRVALFLAGRHVPSLRYLEVEARGGIVTLRGRVGSFYEKQLSQQCCRRVAGVIELVDRVEVTAPPVRRRPALAFLVALAVASTSIWAGCGKADPNLLPVFPVKGQVQFEGRPTPGALVVLHPARADPQTPCPRGKVDKDGAFALSTYSANDGAPTGDYTVTVQWQGLVGSGEDVRIGPSLLPPKYSNPKTSDLRVRVAEGSNQLAPIQLRR